MSSALREIRKISTSYNGLTEKEAERRLLEYGYNELRERKKASVLSIFLSQFKDFMVIVLL